METQIREQLYAQLEGRQVAFNPLEPEPFDLVDLTIDVTNSTKVYHLRTECVREALAGARLIVTDSQPLANAVRRVLPHTPVTALPYGFLKAEVNPADYEEPVVGLLNHNGDVEQNNAFALKFLKKLKREFLIFGQPLPDIEGEVVEDLAEFAGKCDILLLPSLPGALNSLTLPLALMELGTIILASNAPGHYDLNATTRVQLLPNDPAAWRQTLDLLANQPLKVKVMKDRNMAFARRLNRDSKARLAPTIAHLPAYVPAGGDCGCDKKKKSKKAPAEPTPEPEEPPVEEAPEDGD